MRNSKIVLSRYVGLLQTLASLLVVAMMLLIVVVAVIGVSMLQVGSDTIPLLKAVGVMGLIAVIVFILLVGIGIYISWMVLAAYLQTILNIEENTEDAAGTLAVLGGSIDRLAELLEQRVNTGNVFGGQQSPPGQPG